MQLFEMFSYICLSCIIIVDYSFRSDAKTITKQELGEKHGVPKGLSETNTKKATAAKCDGGQSASVETRHAC
jgi:hypothetical protein